MKEFVYDPEPPRLTGKDLGWGLETRYALEDKIIESKRFHPAELAAEFWHQEGIANGKWEGCYPYHNEESDKWPDFLLAAERTAALERFAICKDAHPLQSW